MFSMLKHLTLLLPFLRKIPKSNFVLNALNVDIRSNFVSPFWLLLKTSTLILSLVLVFTMCQTTINCLFSVYDVHEKMSHADN